MNAGTKVDSIITAQDSSLVMLQMFQKLHKQMAERLAHHRKRSEAQVQAMQTQRLANFKLLASQMEAIANIKSKSH